MIAHSPVIVATGGDRAIGFETRAIQNVLTLG